MTATDELRRLLDERGVEWSGTSFSTPAKGHPTNTSFGEEHHEATFIEYHDGNVLRLFDLTPEQAIEATLGRGTCHETIIDHHWRGCCSCGYIWEFMYGIGKCERPHYCPNCGRKVVDA